MKNPIFDARTSHLLPPQRLINSAFKTKRPPVVHVLASQDEVEKYQSTIEWKLGDGIVPDILIENAHLIGKGESQQADEVITYIHGVLNRLSLKNTGHSLPPLDIYLADQPGLVLGVITKAKTPLLMVGLGTLDFLVQHKFDEDHLAAANSHERFHIRRHEKWKHLKNGRPEEAIADIYAVIETHHAGYNPRAAVELFKKFDEIDQNDKRIHDKAWRKKRDWVLSLFDEHPPNVTRIRNTEVALAGLQLTKKLNETNTPIPDRIISLLGEIHYRSPFDKYMLETKYTEASAEKKVDLLGTFIEKTLSLEDTVHCRIRLLTTLPQFLELRGNPRSAQKARQWFDHFMEQKEEWGYSNSHEPRHWVLKQFLWLASGEKPTLSLGSEQKIVFNYNDRDSFDNNRVPAALRTLPRYSQSFMNAQSFEEAYSAAQNLEKARRVVQKYRRGLYLFGLTEEGFEWPSRGDIKKAIENGSPLQLPWERHLRWATGVDTVKGSTQTERDLIKNVVLSLGVRDPRLEKEEGNLHYGPNQYKSYIFDDLSIDKGGFIVAIRPSEDELREKYLVRFRREQPFANILRRELVLQRRRDRREQALLKKIDWRDMEQDFWGFVGRHSDHLQPAMTVVSGQHPFARAFVTKLNELVESNPTRWHPVKNTFVTGYWPAGEVKKRDREEDKYYPNSMPDLIAKFETRYFGYGDPRHHVHVKRGKLRHNHPAKKLLSEIPEYFYNSDNFETKYESKVVNGHAVYQERKVKIKTKPKEKQDVYCYLRVDAAHPYLGLLLSLPKDEINDSHKNSLFSKFRYDNPNTRQAGQYFSVNPARMMGFSPAQSHKDIDELSYSLPSGYDNGPNLSHDTIPLELHRVLKDVTSETRKTKKRRFSLSHIQTQYVLARFRFMHDLKLAKTYERELGDYVDATIDQNRQIDFDPKRRLKVLINDFYKDHGDGTRWSDPYSVFASRQDLKRSYEDHIQSRIKSLPVEKRQGPLASLMRLELERPDYREWAVESWLEASALTLGIDDGSPNYARRAKRVIKQALSSMHPSHGIAAVIGLLDRVETQKDVTFWTKERLIDRYGQQFLERDASARLIDALTDHCSHDAKLRQSFLKFITEPESKDGNKALIEEIEKKIPSSEVFKKYLNPATELVLPYEERVVKTGLAHKNFWRMPFELRTIYLDRILFPVRESNSDEFNKAVVYVLDQVLPPQKKFATEAREALLTYLDRCPVELRRVTFSALLSATEQKAGQTQLRPGQVLSFVLARTGAAGGQILQSAHSLLNGMEIKDPDLCQFRDDLKSSKVDFARPYRWEIFERREEVLPQSAIEKTHHVGKILGAGSTAYVVACEGAEGVTALKLMRKDVLPIANLQFERYREAFVTLAEKHSYYKPLPAIVDRAVETIQVSTDGRIAAQQVRYAESIYNGLTIQVNGETFRPQVAPVVSAGKEYLETRLVTGQHLGNLPTTHPKQKTYRRNSAIALDAVEEYLTLIGAAIDEDCHGGQQKLDGGVMGRFDVGAIPFNLAQQAIAMPTKAQRRALGQLHGLIINAALEGNSPITTMTRAVVTRDWGQEKQYLVGWQRARLARADFFADFGESEEEKRSAQAQIIKAVWQTGRVDPTIIKGMTETLSVTSAFRLAKMLLKPALTSASQTLGSLFRAAGETLASPQPHPPRDDINISDTASPSRVLPPTAVFLYSFVKQKTLSTLRR